jgi:hypothetical protein
MKISDFNTGLKWNNRYGKTPGGSGTAPDYTPVFRKASGGEDFLEISDEAVKRFKEAKILSYEDGRKKRDARESEVTASEINLKGMTRAERIMDLISNDRYDFNDIKILGETAERVMSFIS